MNFQAELHDITQLQGNRMKKIEKYVIIDKEGNEAVKMEEVSYEEIY